MNYWLMKSEPASFGIDDLARAPRKTTSWDGIRNHQVRDMLRDQMREGDLAMFYHSSCAVPGIVGIMKVSRAAYPDTTSYDLGNPHFDPHSTPAKPRWFAVDMTLVERFKRPVTLMELRRHAALDDMRVLHRGNRLSITPMTADQWHYILKMTAVS